MLFMANSLIKCAAKQVDGHRGFYGIYLSAEMIDSDASFDA